MMNQTILVNEIGYRPEDPKRAVYRGESDAEFSVVECAGGKEVFRGKANFVLIKDCLLLVDFPVGVFNSPKGFNAAFKSTIPCP